MSSTPNCLTWSLRNSYPRMLKKQSVLRRDMKREHLQYWNATFFQYCKSSIFSPRRLQQEDSSIHLSTFTGDLCAGEALQEEGSFIRAKTYASCVNDSMTIFKSKTCPNSLEANRRWGEKCKRNAATLRRYLAWSWRTCFTGGNFVKRSIEGGRWWRRPWVWNWSRWRIVTEASIRYSVL